MTTTPTPPPALAIMEAVKPERQLVIPSVDEFLTESYPLFPFNKVFETARFRASCRPVGPLFATMSSIDNQNKRTALIRHRRHTSRSTGLPKPTTWTHESAVRHMRNTDLEPPEGGLRLSNA